MGELHHCLPRRDDLTGLGQGLDHGSVRVGEKQGISSFIPRDARLRLGLLVALAGILSSLFEQAERRADEARRARRKR